MDKCMIPAMPSTQQYLPHHHVGQCPRTVPPDLFAQWTKDKAPSMTNDIWRSTASDRCIEVITTALARRVVSVDERGGCAVDVSYERSKRQLVSGHRVGRFFGASLRRLTRAIRPLVYGEFCEIHMQNPMPTVLVAFLLTEILLPQCDGDEAQARRKLGQMLPALYRLGSSPAERDRMVAEVLPQLAERVTQWREAQDFPRLASLRIKTDILAEEHAGALSSFRVDAAIAEEHLCSQVLRPWPPSATVRTDLSCALWEDSEQCFKLVKEWLAGQPKHWAYPVLQNGQDYARAISRKGTQSHPCHIPDDQAVIARPCSKLPTGGSRPVVDAGVPEMDNLKGTFLSVLCEEIEQRQLLCIDGYLHHMACSHNAAGALPPRMRVWDQGWPLLDDGIMVPFDVTDATLAKLTDFVNDRLGGCYRPLFGRRCGTLPPLDDPLMHHVVEVQALIDCISTSTRGCITQARVDLLLKHVYPALVAHRDLLFRPDGRPHADGVAYDEQHFLRQFWKVNDWNLEELEAFLLRCQTPATDTAHLPLGCIRMPKRGAGQNHLEGALHAELDFEGLLDYEEVAAAYSVRFYEVINPPEPGRKYLRRSADGTFVLLSEQDLLREDGQLQCRQARIGSSQGSSRRARWECVPFMKEWLHERTVCCGCIWSRNPARRWSRGRSRSPTPSTRASGGASPPTSGWRRRT